MPLVDPGLLFNVPAFRYVEMIPLELFGNACLERKARGGTLAVCL
jgi:hypothetical protein